MTMSMRNSEANLELNPGGFTRVVMQYVDMEVSGVPLKAFLNTGSQFTVISRSCAAWCGLLGLIDQRYKGIAHGVGESETLGRIYVAPIKIGSVYYPFSFVVLNSPSLDDLILGLDVLRKHQCMIDLKQNALRVCVGDVSVPILHEKDAPQHCLDEERYLKELASGSKATDLQAMLYVDIEVNGESVKVLFDCKAFVDTGAHLTIISKSCAKRCGYKSIQSEILGFIHVAPIKIGSMLYPCSFLVLDSPNMNLVFGLDMLRKNQCIIDLKENVLRVGVGEVHVPLLQGN